MLLHLLFSFLIISIMIKKKKQKFWIIFYMFFFVIFFFKLFLKTREIIRSFHYRFIYVDNISSVLVWLSVFVVILSFLSILLLINIDFFIISFSMVLIFFILIFFFITSNFFFFFIIFELSLLPIFFLVKFFRDYKERIFSLYYFFFFTIILSVPLFLVVIYFIKNGERLIYYTLLKHYQKKIHLYIILRIILRLLRKLPIYRLHIWLPKAHVDAPIRRSIILARVLLKLRRYGVIRSIFFINYSFSYLLSFLFFFLGSFRYFFTSFICLRILDSKVIIAFSSVSHMSLAFVRSISRLYISFKGRYFIYLRHRLVSPSIFFIVFLLSKIYNTRNLVGIKSFINNNKFLFFYILIFCLFNIRIPPTINFFSEIFIMIRISKNFFFFIIVIFIGFVFNAIYLFNMLRLFSQSKIMCKIFKETKIDFFIFYLFLFFFLLMTFFLDTIILHFRLCN